jgi:hypothetical protein
MKYEIKNEFQLCKRIQKIVIKRMMIKIEI